MESTFSSLRSKNKWPNSVILALCGILIIGVGAIDYVTGAQASVAVVYLLPIALGTWAVSRNAGLILATASVLVWFLVERIQAAPYSHPFIQFWNAFALLLSFGVVVSLLSILSRSYVWLEEEVRKRTSQLTQALTDLRKSHATLKETQLQLIQAAKMESVGILAAGIAHEVKNPLMTISMGLDFMEHPTRTIMHNDAVVAVLKDQRDAVVRATGIINELLDFSAPSELEICPEDLNAVIERSLGLMKHELTKGRIVVVRDFQMKLPRISMDSKKMQQLFVNVFTNAIHAMPNGGTLTVHTLSESTAQNGRNSDSRGVRSLMGEDTVTVHVDDTGPGFPEIDLPRVFDPFFTTKAPRNGTGLGLYIVRQIAEMHCGAVAVSNHTAGGARVTARFPVSIGAKS